MKSPRDVDGVELADHLCRFWGYTKISQVGSHIMLRTEKPSRAKQVVPAHSPVKIGTLRKILKQVATHKQVDPDDILRDL